MTDNEHIVSIILSRYVYYGDKTLLTCCMLFVNFCGSGHVHDTMLLQGTTTSRMEKRVALRSKGL